MKLTIQNNLCRVHHDDNMLGYCFELPKVGETVDYYFPCEVSKQSALLGGDNRGPYPMQVTEVWATSGHVSVKGVVVREANKMAAAVPVSDHKVQPYLGADAPDGAYWRWQTLSSKSRFDTPDDPVPAATAPAPSVATQTGGRIPQRGDIVDYYPNDNEVKDRNSTTKWKGPHLALVVFVGEDKTRVNLQAFHPVGGMYPYVKENVIYRDANHEKYDFVHWCWPPAVNQLTDAEFPSPTNKDLASKKEAYRVTVEGNCVFYASDAQYDGKRCEGYLYRHVGSASFNENDTYCGTCGKRQPSPDEFLMAIRRGPVPPRAFDKFKHDGDEDKDDKGNVVGVQPGPASALTPKFTVGQWVGREGTIDRGHVVGTQLRENELSEDEYRVHWIGMQNRDFAINPAKDLVAIDKPGPVVDPTAQVLCTYCRQPVTVSAHDDGWFCQLHGRVADRVVPADPVPAVPPPPDVTSFRFNIGDMVSDPKGKTCTVVSRAETYDGMATNYRVEYRNGHVTSHWRFQEYQLMLVGRAPPTAPKHDETNDKGTVSGLLREAQAMVDDIAKLDTHGPKALHTTLRDAGIMVDELRFMLAQVHAGKVAQADKPANLPAHARELLERTDAWLAAPMARVTGNAGEAFDLLVLHRDMLTRWYNTVVGSRIVIKAEDPSKVLAGLLKEAGEAGAKIIDEINAEEATDEVKVGDGVWYGGSHGTVVAIGVGYQYAQLHVQFDGVNGAQWIDRDKLSVEV